MKAHWKELGLIFFLFILFVFVRSVYFKEHLNFTADQATQSTEVLQFFQDKKLPLRGNPITSIQFQGHYMFQGPAYYYMLFVFLYLTSFDPIISSYLFMIFAGLMLFPLYFGLSKLINKQLAIIASLIYAFLPYYVDYTRFHWNPNYQLVFLPLLFFSMGKYKQTNLLRYLFSVALTLGILLHFHYQFVLVVFGIFLYYALIQKEQAKRLLIFLAGVTLGISPVILFELKNQFYNIQTFLLFLRHRDEISIAGSTTTPHYYLSFSFVLFVLCLGILSKLSTKLSKKSILCNKKLQNTTIVLLAFLLFVWTALLTFQRPSKSFWSYPEHMNYLVQQKAYGIITKQNLKNYNVADLTYYDTKASVIKYLLKKDSRKIDADNYTTNDYLFVIFRNKNFMENAPYEVVLMNPSKLEKTWDLNGYYSLYLLKRLPKT